MCSEFEAFPATVKSRHGCPVCGGKQWGCYRVVARNAGYISPQWGVASVDLLAEGFLVLYRPGGGFPWTTFYFDECLTCGTVVS